MSEREPRLVIIQTVNRKGETSRMIAVFARRLAPRFLRDPRVQELIGDVDEPLDSSSKTTFAHVVGMIVERGRRPIQVIPFKKNPPFTPIP